MGIRPASMARKTSWAVLISDSSLPDMAFDISSPPALNISSIAPRAVVNLKIGSTDNSTSISINWPRLSASRVTRGWEIGRFQNCHFGRCGGLTVSSEITSRVCLLDLSSLKKVWTMALRVVCLLWLFVVWNFEFKLELMPAVLSGVPKFPPTVAFISAVSARLVCKVSLSGTVERTDTNKLLSETSSRYTNSLSWILSNEELRMGICLLTFMLWNSCEQHSIHH